MAKGVFVRDEEVYISPVAGVVKLLVRDGAMVRAKTPVARVEAFRYGSGYESGDGSGHRPGIEGSPGDAVVLSTRSPGIVRYDIDGLESILCRGSVPGLALKELTSLSKPHGLIKNGARVSGGEAIFKVIDPTCLDILVYGSAGEIGRLSAGERVWVRFPGKGIDPVPGRVENVSAPSALISLDEWVRGADRQRFADVRIVSNISEGVSVPIEAIFTRGGKTFVYLSRRSGILMREVSIRARDSRYAIVTGVGDGQAVITNPLVIERQGM